MRFNLNRRVAEATGILTSTLMASICSAGGVQYTFINIADSTGPINTTIEEPVINNNREVAFWCVPDTGGHAIYRTNGGALSTVATAGSGQNFTSLNRAGSLNVNGVTVFHASTSQGHGIYAGDGGAIIPIVTPPQYSNPNEYPSINDSGMAAFIVTPVATFQRGVHIGNGGKPTGLYQVNNGPFLSFGDAAINNAGNIVFQASQVGGVVGIFRGNGGPFDTIADNTREFQSFGSKPDINSSGLVVFAASFDTGSGGVFVGDGTSITTIAGSDGPYNINFSVADPSINDSGQVVFFASLDGGSGQGIYTGPDPVEDKVISVGDSLFGSTVLQVDIERDALNDHGDIAFRYILVNGVAGIAIARAPVPAVPGDTNGDGVINVADLLAVISAWGNCPQPCPPHCNADVNDDCAVNVADLLMVISNWG